MRHTVACFAQCTAFVCILALLPLLVQAQDASNAQCAKGNYAYEYRKKDAPCDKEKCMLHAPCASEFVRGSCAAEGACKAVSLKICDANTGICSWSTPQLPPLPGAVVNPGQLPQTPQAPSQPLPDSSSPLRAFSDAQRAADQARVDTASQRLQEAFDRLQNDPANYAQHFNEAREAQEDLLLAQRLRDNPISPSLRDYLKGIVAPRLTPAELLPDGNIAPIRTREWINNFGSTFMPFEVADLGNTFPLPQPPNCTPGEAGCSNLVPPTLLQHIRTNLSQFPEYLRETIGPGSDVGETYLRPGLDNAAKLLSLGYCGSWGECFGPPAPIRAQPREQTLTLTPLELLPPSPLSPFDFSAPPTRELSFSRPLEFPWTGETALAEPELQRMLEEEKALRDRTAAFARPVEFPGGDRLAGFPRPLEFPRTETPTPPAPQPAPPPTPLPPEDSPPVPTVRTLAPSAPPQSAGTPGPSSSGTGASILSSLQSLLPSIWSLLMNLFNWFSSQPAAPAQQAPQPQPPTPTATLIANPPRIEKGKTAQLVWSSVNADSCTIYLPDNSIFISDGPNGSATTSPLSTTTTFRVTCSKGPVSATSAVTVTVR